jgi:hypothetical protein
MSGRPRSPCFDEPLAVLFQLPNARSFVSLGVCGRALHVMGDDVRIPRS